MSRVHNSHNSHRDTNLSLWAFIPSCALAGMLLHPGWLALTKG